MDSTASSMNLSSEKDRPIGLILAALIAASALFITVGIKYSEGNAVLEGVSFYGRYSGIGAGVTDHIIAAVTSSALSLTEILLLYLMSFSPLFVPTAFALTGIRGFIAGAAYSAVNSTAAAAQLVLHCSVTLMMCIFASCLMHKKDGYILNRTIVLAVFAGVCTSSELIISYIS